MLDPPLADAVLCWIRRLCVNDKMQSPIGLLRKRAATLADGLTRIFLMGSGSVKQAVIG
jgi:hypothetical protein